MMGKKQFHHLTSYSKHDDFDDYLISLMTEKHGQRFIDYRKDWNNASQLDHVPKFPLMIGVETIDRCNYVCGHCYRAHHKGSDAKISHEDFKRVVDEGVSFNLPSLIFGGGSEPLLHPKAMDMVQYALTSGIMDVLLSTNAVPLTHEKIDNLLDWGLTRIGISLDAATPETYKLVRGGNLEAVESNIRYLIEQKEKRNLRLPILRVSFVIQKENEHEQELFLDKWKDVADKVDFQKFLDFSSVDDLKKVESDSFFCSQAWERVNIWSTGDVSPCCTFYGKHHLYGNIKTQSIKEIWDSSKTQQLRQSIKNSKPPLSCLNCYGNLK